MSNINLYQDPKEILEGKSKKRSVFSRTFVWPVGILVLICLIFGGLKFINANLTHKSDMLIEEIAQAKNSFSGGDIDRVIDFNERIDRIDANISSKFDSTKVLDSIEKYMIKDVVVTSYKYEVGKNNESLLAMEFEAKDFLEAAKQILNLKNDASLKNVTVVETGKVEDKIRFKISAVFN